MLDVATLCTFGLGACLGVILMLGGSFALFRPRKKNAYTMSAVCVLMVVILDVCYCILKLMQLNHPQIPEYGCVALEEYSVVLFLSSHCCMYSFYILRYKEVYGVCKMLLVMVLLVVVNLVAIPVSLTTNEIILGDDGGCIIKHRQVSYYYPMIIAVLVNVTMTTLFVKPMLKSVNTHTRKVGKTLALTNFIATAGTVTFYITLATPADVYAPLLSAADLTNNLMMATLPYLLKAGRAAKRAVTLTPSSTRPPKRDKWHKLFTHNQAGTEMSASPKNKPRPEEADEALKDKRVSITI